MNIHPVTLEGKVVRLEPMTHAHLDRLCEVGLDEDLWKLTTVNIRTAQDMKRYIDTALNDFAQGKALPFVVVERGSETVVGSTRFGNIDLTHRRVEIGWTWIARRWQRSAVNTEAKYLLLSHAFDTLGCIRVEFKTDSTNTRSRNALLRIGAKEEGTFRNHMIVPDGRIRHSVYFSIIDSEWDTVRRELQKKMDRNA
ncbi:MAG TPA: GNAT family protein [Bacteroidota bacterium]|nr:GNAT family protein [Bacteroidota bacterium]